MIALRIFLKRNFVGLEATNGSDDLTHARKRITVSRDVPAAYSV